MRPSEGEGEDREIYLLRVWQVIQNRIANRTARTTTSVTHTRHTKKTRNASDWRKARKVRAVN